jgi:hypothetical protein
MVAILLLRHGRVTSGTRHNHKFGVILRFLVLAGCISLLTTVFLFDSFHGQQGRSALARFWEERRCGNGQHRLLKPLQAESGMNSRGVQLQRPGTSDRYPDIDDMPEQQQAEWVFVTERDAENYGLTEEQCGLAFPKLYVELEKSVRQREANRSMITLKEVQSRRLDDGMVRAMVYRGQVSTVLFRYHRCRDL